MGKSLGTGYRDVADLAADPDLLDPPIRPLVQALNQTGWAHTIFSCAGHPEEPDSTQTGRRQAHIDLLVNNLPLWQTYIRSLPRTPNIRVTEGSLGLVPPWLPVGVQGAPPPVAPEARNSKLGLGGPGERSVPRRGTWHYRRLVLEPIPYDMPALKCRLTLDMAIAAATSALQSPAPHTSHANTH